MYFLLMQIIYHVRLLNKLRACLKITYFTQFRCCQKNLILKIIDVFLRLNSSSALNLNKLSNFQTASYGKMDLKLI
jgi:hypothetical protein